MYRLKLHKIQNSEAEVQEGTYYGGGTAKSLAGSLWEFLTTVSFKSSCRFLYIPYILVLGSLYNYGTVLQIDLKMILVFDSWVAVLSTHAWRSTHKMHVIPKCQPPGRRISLC